jgi:hypothetical protein
MIKICLAASLALLVLAPATPAAAQERSKLVLPERESTEVMLLRVSASSRCRQDCSVRGAPYSAERVTESVQVLTDGNRIVQRLSEHLYRDALGRSRVESEWQGSALVQIQDPIQGMSYRLYPEDKAGIRMPIGTPGQPGNATIPAVSAGSGAARVAEKLAPAFAGTAPASDSQRSTRSLGTRQMEGLTVHGTLQTTTIPAGESGNTLPIVSTVESWHARDLKLDLYVKSSDPRTGERIIRIQNIRRAEPSAALFTAPDDYRVRAIARH